MARRLLALLLLLAPFLEAAQQQAWWLTVTFTPVDTSYAGVPASAIKPAWTKISVLSEKSLPGEASEDLPWMRKDGFLFQADNQFRRKGVPDRVVCGVYETKTGERGRFLLVLERAKSGNWTSAYVVEQPGEAGFSVLSRKSGRLHWSTCMECDDLAWLRLKQGVFALETEP